MSVLPSTRVDPARRRLQLQDSELSAVAGLWRRQGGENTDVPADVETRMRDAGLVDRDGGLHPLLADFAQCADAPMMTFTVEMLHEQGLSVAHVFVRDEDVWSSDPWPVREAVPEPLVAYERSELPFIIWTLTRLVGLRRVLPPEDAAAMTAPLATVQSVLASLLGAEDWDDVRTVATTYTSTAERRLPAADHRQWLAILATLRSSWRITCQWGPLSDEVPTASGLVVLDCGERGYWQRTEPAEPLDMEALDLSTTARLVPVSGGEVWRLVTDLLPSSEEMRAVRDLLAEAVADA